MKLKYKIIFLLSWNFFQFSYSESAAQPWVEDNHIFNPTGIPSLSFSQPRFYDLDGDSDLDMILGSTVRTPIYFENIGSKTNPKFQQDNSLFAIVNTLDAEMGVCVDIDGDADLDFISGGYTGLNFYENVGNSTQPEFSKSSNIFSKIVTGENPIPTFADMDGDGDLDLAIGLSENGGVKYYINSGSKNSPEFLESNGVLWFDVGLYAYPYFCDFDKDGDNDILVGRDVFGIKYYENIGDSLNYIWSDKSTFFQNLGTTTYWNSGALVDLSGDGKYDFIFGTASGQIFYYTNTGTSTSPTWIENTSVFGGTIDIGSASSPLLFDYDGDGDLDMFTGTQLGNIKYFENIGTRNNPAWKENSAFLSNVKHSIYSAVAVGDLNKDGKYDLIVGDFTGKLYLHLQTSSGFPKVTTAMNISVDGFAVPRLIDFDNDSELELIVGRDNGTISFYENTGTVDSPNWFEVLNYFTSIDVGSDAVPSIVDFDKDGDYDLIVGDLFGEVKFFYNNNSEWVEDATVFENIVVDQNAAPACADLDSDGDYDLVLGNYEGTFSYFNNQSVTAIENEVASLTNFILFQNYPNPFNPSTVISYSIPVNVKSETSNVKLVVYDILGNELATLVNERQKSGNYVVKFNASNLPSGVYFYKLESGSFSEVKKMILMK